MTNSFELPLHRADLAGVLAARTNVGRYLEIVSGLLLGLLMWVLDAAMHARLSATPSLSLFLDELLRPGIIPALFRGAFVAVAISIGWMLWRMNLRHEAAARQERDRALASERLRTMLAFVTTFRREVDQPLALIAASAQDLAGRLREVNDREKLTEIEELAVRILSFSKQLANSAPLYLVDRSGTERIVPGNKVENGSLIVE